MKRFYCTVCNKQKRVQKWPLLITHADDTLVEYRKGECNWHRNPSLLQRKPRAPKYITPSAPVKVASGKRGR